MNKNTIELSIGGEVYIDELSNIEEIIGMDEWIDQYTTQEFVTGTIPASVGYRGNK